MNLAPKTVTVVRDGKEQVIDAADVVQGDIFVIKPGESVAVDGVILEGNPLLMNPRSPERASRC